MSISETEKRILALIPLKEVREEALEKVPADSIVAAQQLHNNAREALLEGWEEDVEYTLALAEKNKKNADACEKDSNAQIEYEITYIELAIQALILYSIIQRVREVKDRSSPERKKSTFLRRKGETKQEYKNRLKKEAQDE